MIRGASDTSIEEIVSLAAPYASVLENEPMSRHTTFRIGGPARLFMIPRSVGALENLLRLILEHGLPVFILGNGSNLLVSDKGIDGAVLSTAGLRGVRIDGERMVCLAGTKLEDACIAARENGLSGLEFAYGIPGTVGGAVYMNAGAYGGEMKDVVVRTNHLEGCNKGSYDRAGLDFGYRRSAYTDTGRVITEVEFLLRPGKRAEIGARMEELMQRRKSKQPLEYPSAGSVFKRPPGKYAGTLIESCGLKGLRVGGAMVSQKHAGFIINTGGATCGDVMALIEKIKDEVFRQTGVELESEIRFVGIK